MLVCGTGDKSSCIFPTIGFCVSSRFRIALYYFPRFSILHIHCIGPRIFLLGRKKNAADDFFCYWLNTRAPNARVCVCIFVRLWCNYTSYSNCENPSEILYTYSMYMMIFKVLVIPIACPHGLVWTSPILSVCSSFRHKSGILWRTCRCFSHGGIVGLVRVSVAIGNIFPTHPSDTSASTEEVSVSKDGVHNFFVPFTHWHRHHYRRAIRFAQLYLVYMQRIFLV